MDRAKFYEVLRPHMNLTQGNVYGCERLLDYIEANPMNPNIAAYAFATAWWESGQTMAPVREAFWLSEAWRKRNLRYYPYYGRGLVQTTWKENYQKVAALLGLDKNFFIDNPDKLLEWEHAVPALFKACEAGIYTGKSFQDYIDAEDESDAEDFKEYKAARRVVNGTDKDDTIASLALHFEHALRGGGYTGNPVLPDLQNDLDQSLVARINELNQTMQQIADIANNAVASPKEEAKAATMGE